MFKFLGSIFRSLNNLAESLEVATEVAKGHSDIFKAEMEAELVAKRKALGLDK